MPHEVTMPQLGMAQDAGRIVSWLKQPGDAVARGDALFEVETDKATMEVEAQASGFLTHVHAQAGEDVPVGQTIARISESAEEDEAPAPPAAAEPTADDALPEGAQVTMPQLGMAQDSGIMVGWLVEPGSAVGPDDPLFEVETDKATMEVPAGASGYLAATLAQAGDEVPVGQAVAVISPEKPDSPLTRAAAQGAALPEASKTQAQQTTPDPAPEPAAKAVADPVIAAPPSGRILASPKLRRVALEKGLELARLVEAGHPQPYHMRDLETLETLSKDIAVTAPATAAQAIRLEAVCPQDGFAPFAAWAAEVQGLRDGDALLAGLAGAGLEGAVTVAVERFGARRAFAVPEGRHLSAVSETDTPPALLLRDLRTTRLQAVSMGAAELPVLTLMQQGAGLSLVLECSPDQIAPDDAIALLCECAGRMEDPLRHLL